MAHEQLVTDEINDLQEIKTIWKRSAIGIIQFIVSRDKMLEWKVLGLENSCAIIPASSEVFSDQDYSAFLNIKNEIYGFKAKIKINALGNILVEEPSKLFKINRRANFRLEIEDPAVKICWIDYIQEKTMIFKAIDMSLGGLSFEIKEDQKRLFKKDQVITRVKLIYNEKEIEFDLIVKNILPYKKNYKVGIQFHKHYSQLNLNMISNYIILNKSQLAKKYAS